MSRFVFGRIIPLCVLVFVGFCLWIFEPRLKPGLEVSSAQKVALTQQAKDLGLRLRMENEESSSYIREQMKVCFGMGGANGCYKAVGELLFSQFGAPVVMEVFKANESYPEIFSRCHEVTHYLGRMAFTSKSSVPLAYSESSPVCHGGYYHGVLEQYFYDKEISFGGLDEGTIKSEVATVCGKQEDYDSSRVHAECLHGIGHAMMFITEAELPLALELCNGLPDTGGRETCYGGVFMENSSSSTNLDHPTKYLRSDDPMHPCNILEEPYLKTCYQYQSSYFAELSRWDWGRVAVLCGQVPPRYKAGCFEIMGSNQVGYTQDTERMKLNCKLIGDLAMRQECIRGIVSSFGGRFVGDPSAMLSFCADVEPNLQEICFVQIGRSVHGWPGGAVARAEVCGRINEPTQLDWCLKEN